MTTYRDARTRGAESVKYCRECGRWTGHEANQQGRFTCRVCGEEGPDE